MSLPKISLLTAVYNGERFLAETLATIRAQKYPNLEYIVMDGGSNDGTLAILEQNQDIISLLISEKDRGMYDALNKGFKRATGEIYGWIGADDLLMPWCLHSVAKHFQSHPECQWATGIPTLFDGNGHMTWTSPIVPHYRRSWIRKRWYSAYGLGWIQQESTYFKRELFEKAGGLEPCLHLKAAGDIDLWCRMAEHADLQQIGLYIAGYRQHGTNMGGDMDRYAREGKLARIPGGRKLGISYSLFKILNASVRK